MTTYLGTYAFLSDIGKVRKDNEDNAYVLANSDHEVFLMVCDGMGGMQNGALASSLAIESLSESFRKKRGHSLPLLNKMWLSKAVKKANKAINDHIDEKGQMGTTLACALIANDRLYVVGIGDSRVYRVTPEEMEQLTEDETYAAMLAKQGKINDDAVSSHPDRHVLLNALGVNPSVLFTIKEFNYRGETLLLCSDGLYNLCSLEEIRGICLTDERADQKVQSLIHAANSHGGSDNIAVSYWETINYD